MAHIGVIRELQARGYPIAAIAGTSIGSMVGGAYASGRLDDVEKFMRAITIDDVVRFIDLTFSNDGFIKGERVFRHMQSFWPDVRIEELPVPLAIAASNLDTGSKHVFRSGSLYRAMRASIAIPLLFTAVHLGGHTLVDGGLTDLLPFDDVERPKGSIVVAVNLYGPTDERLKERPALVHQRLQGQSFWHKLQLRIGQMRDWRVALYRSMLSGEASTTGYVPMMRRSSNLLLMRQAALSIALHRPDVLIEVPNNCAGALDFHRSRRIINMGRTRCAAALDAWEAAHRSWGERLIDAFGRITQKPHQESSKK